MKCNLKDDAQVDNEVLRLFQLDEKTKPGSEVDIPSEVLWRVGVYDVEDFEEKLGHLFEKPKGLKKRPAAKEEIEKTIEKEAKG